MASIGNGPPPVKPGGPIPHVQREPRAVTLFRQVVDARRLNMIPEGLHFLAELRKEGWQVLPIAPKRGRGGAR